MQSTPPVRPAAATLALTLASVLWGTTGTTASFFPPAISPLAVGAATMTIGGILLFFVTPRGSLRTLAERGSRPWILLGAIGVFVYPLAFYSGMNLAGVAIGNVVALGSGPVFAAFYEWAWERHQLTRRGVASTALAVAGVLLLGFAGHPSTAAGASVFAGVGLGLLAGAAYALYTYSSTRAIRLDHAGRAVMGGTFGVGGILLLPVLLVTGSPLLASGGTLGIAAYLAIGPMFIAYLLFGTALRNLRSSAVTTITLLEPVVATILAVTVVGERLTYPGWAGIVLILAGVFLLATARQHPKGEVQP